MKGTAAISGGHIFVRIPIGIAAKGRTIAGGAWDPAARIWTYPADAATARQVLNVFEFDRGNDQLHALIAKLAPLTPTAPIEAGECHRGCSPASEVSIATPPPGPPVDAQTPAPPSADPDPTETASEVAIAAGEDLDDRGPSQPRSLFDLPDHKADLVPKLPLLETPATFKLSPWNHQRVGYTFGMAALQQHNAVLLAAQMGTGKTLVAAMLATGRGAKAILVVCPLRVVPNWAKEIVAYIDGPKVVASLNRGTSSRRRQTAEEGMALAIAAKRPIWVLINYDSYWRPGIAEWIKAQKWDMMILDESHRIKSAGGRASIFAKSLRARVRDVVLATGTPMAHSQLDVYGQFRAARPQVFGTSYAAFKQRYAKMGGPDKKWIVGYQNSDDLERRMAPYTWRCTKREALPDLPDEMDVEYSTEFDAEAERIYREMEKDLIAEIDGGQITAANALTKVLRLQQICGGCVPTDDGHAHVIDRSKHKLLVDVLDDLGRQPIIIFAQFKADLATCHEACKEAGFTSLELSGSRDELAQWQAGGADVLVTQNQSGSVGINGTRASVDIYFSLSTSLMIYDQSRSRTHRGGQMKKCLHIYLTIKGTVDQKILKGLRNRQDVIEFIMASVAKRAADARPEIPLLVQ